MKSSRACSHWMLRVRCDGRRREAQRFERGIPGGREVGRREGREQRWGWQHRPAAVHSKGFKPALPMLAVIDAVRVA